VSKQRQSRDQLGCAEQDQRGIEKIEMTQQKGKIWSFPSSGPGATDLKLLAIQLAAFGSGGRVDEAA